MFATRVKVTHVQGGIFLRSGWFIKWSLVRRRCSDIVAFSFAFQGRTAVFISPDLSGLELESWRCFCKRRTRTAFHIKPSPNFYFHLRVCPSEEAWSVLEVDGREKQGKEAGKQRWEGCGMLREKRGGSKDEGRSDRCGVNWEQR